MSGALGDLVVRLGADIAKFESAMGKAEMLANRSAKSINDAMDNVDRRILQIGAGFVSFKAIDAFVESIDGAIKFAATLDDMSEKTGASVETLSQLATVAKISGQDMAGLEGGMTKLAKGIAATVETGKGASNALSVLGINAKDAAGNLRDTGAITKDIAASLAKYADGTGKAAIAQELFGKSGAQMLPFLKDLALTGSLVTKVTAEQAAQAETYEKTIVKLKIAGDDLSRSLAMGFLPVMQTVADMYLKAKTSADGLTASTERLSANGDITKWAESAAYAAAFVVDALRAVNVAAQLAGEMIGGTIRIAIALAEGVAGGALTGNMAAAYAMGAKMSALQKDTKAQLDAILAGHKSIRLELEAQFATQKMINEIVARNSGPEGKDSWDRRLANPPKLNFTVPNDTTAKASEYALALADANKRLAASYAEIQNPLDAMTASEKRLSELRSSPIWETFTTAQRINLRVTLEGAAGNERLVAAQKKARDGMAEWTKEIESANAEYAAYAAKQDQALLDIYKRAEAIDIEVANYGKLPSAVEATTLALMKESLAMLENSGASDAMIESKRQAVQAQEALVKSLQNREGFQATLSVVNDIANAVGDIAVGFAKGVGNGIDVARQKLKQFLYDLVAMLAKTWVLNIAAAGTFGSSIANAAGSALTASSSSPMGSLVSAGLSASGLSAIGADFMAGFSAGSYGAGATSMGIAGSAGQLVGTAWEAFVALGPVGWIAAAAAIAYSIFGQKGGGPKSGGSAMYSADATGNVTADLGFKPLYTTSGQNLDDAVKPIIEATARSYAAFAKMFGGTSSASFGQSFDTDPQGTAENRARTIAYVNGIKVFDQKNENLGREAEKLGPELELQASRALIAALQASELQANIAKIFDGFDAASATKVQIDALITSALDMRNVIDTLANITIPGLTVDALEKLNKSGETLTQTLSRVADAFYSAAGDIMQSADRISGGALGAILRQNEQEAAATNWNAIWNGIAGTATTNAQTIANVQQYSGNPEVLQSMINAAYTQGGQPAVDALRRLFSAVSANTEATTANTSGFSGATNEQNNYIDAMAALRRDMEAQAAARANLSSNVAGYLQNSLFGDNSPLNKVQQLAEARAQYDANYALAFAGNLDAIANFQSYRENLLRAREAVSAHSGAYVADFFGTYDQGAALTQGALRAYSAADGEAMKAALIAQLVRNDTTSAASVTTLQMLLQMFLTGSQVLTETERRYMQDSLWALQRLGQSPNAALTPTSI